MSEKRKFHFEKEQISVGLGLLLGLVISTILIFLTCAKCCRQNEGPNHELFTPRRRSETDNGRSDDVENGSSNPELFTPRIRARRSSNKKKTKKKTRQLGPASGNEMSTHVHAHTRVSSFLEQCSRPLREISRPERALPLPAYSFTDLRAPEVHLSRIKIEEREEKSSLPNYSDLSDQECPPKYDDLQ